MHANPKHVAGDDSGRDISQLRPVQVHNTLASTMLRFLRLLRLALWRAFEHGFDTPP